MKITAIKKYIRHMISRLITMVYGWFHPIEKKVLFSSFGGKQYSDNPRAISEKLHELYPEYRIVWLFNDVNDENIDRILPEYVEKAANTNINRCRQLATCFCSVSNCGRNKGTYKRKGQYFVQTWHGDRGFKKVLFDVNENADVIDNKVSDLCVAGSAAGERKYRSAFRYNGEILNVGSPRNDKLLGVTENEKDRIRALLGMEKDVKLLLYAPTFRDNNKNNQCASVDLLQVLDQLETDGEKWLCLVRAHSASAGLHYETDKRIVDVSIYPDMADILCVADMLITDYSSCAADFALTKKPIILATFDREDYEKSCRSFDYRLGDMGFLYADSQEELIGMLKTLTPADYEESCAKVNSFYAVTETGHSAEAVCRIIDEFAKK